MQQPGPVSGTAPAATTWQGGPAPVQDITEEMVAALVRDFYGRVRDDALLGPMFRAVVPDWEEHLQTVTDFWSRVLLGSDRYGGCVIAAHGRLRMTPAHFDRWLALFQRSARVTLPAGAAERALAVADSLNGRLRAWQAQQQQRD
jgi:hemoglobin